MHLVSHLSLPAAPPADSDGGSAPAGSSVVALS